MKVSAMPNESINRKIPTKEVQRSVWTMGWLSIFLVDNCVHIYSHFPPQFLARDDVLIFWGFLKAFPEMLNIRRIYGSTMSTTMVFLTICHTYCLPKFDHQTLNCASIRYIVSVMHCRVRRTGFAVKYASMILIPCCVVLRPVGSILAPKNLLGLLSTQPEKYEKIVKHNFVMKNKLGHFFFCFRPLEYFPGFRNYIFWWFRE